MSDDLNLALEERNQLAKALISAIEMAGNAYDSLGEILETQLAEPFQLARKLVKDASTDTTYVRLDYFDPKTGWCVGRGGFNTRMGQLPQVIAEVKWLHQRKELPISALIVPLIDSDPVTPPTPIGLATTVVISVRAWHAKHVLYGQAE